MRALAVCLPSFSLLTLLLAPPSVVLAQETPDAERASSLIEEGVELRRGGDDVAALARFQQAYALSPSPRAAAQVGLAQQALGRWVEADERLREALAATDDPFVQEYGAALRSSHEAVREQIGQLHVLGGAPGAVVRFGGRTVGTLPMAAPVTVVIGTSPLEVAADGYHPVEMELSVRAGELTRQMVDMEAMPAPEAPTTAVASEPTASRGPTTLQGPTPSEPSDEGGSVLEEWWFWTIVGAVVVGGVVAGVLIGTQSGGTEAPLEGTLGTSTALSARF